MQTTIAQSPARNHAAPTNTNPPRISPLPPPTQQPADAPTVFVNGTASIPPRSHQTIHTSTPSRLHPPTITYPRTPRIQRTRPFHTPPTTTYVPSRHTIHHHQQNRTHSTRSPASEGTIARQQHHPPDQPSRPSSNHTRTPHSPLSTASLHLTRTTNKRHTTQTLPSVNNALAPQKAPLATSSCPFSPIGPARHFVRTYPHRAHTTSTEPHGATHVRPSSATTT